MTKQFKTLKSLIEHIRSLEALPYERDVEGLRCIADSVNAITLPAVTASDEDDSITIEDGDLNESALESEWTNCNDSAYYTYGFASNSGIVLTVYIGDLEFEKCGRNDKWECLDDGLKDLPSGYEDEELEEELEAIDGTDELDLLSDVIDAKAACDKAFEWRYRLFQSVEDDMCSIALQLRNLDYDGFYWFFRSFYGWKKGMEKPWVNFDPIQLLSAEEVARRYAKLRGWQGGSSCEKSERRRIA